MLDDERSPAALIQMSSLEGRWKKEKKRRRRDFEIELFPRFHKVTKMKVSRMLST